MHDDPEEPIRITPDLIDNRIDFEKGMSIFPKITICLLVSHVIIFIIEMARIIHLNETAATNVFIQMGALETESIKGGEWWRLLSATFMHGNFDHIIGNGIALYILGMACEHSFGWVQFTVLYVVAGLAGSLASITGLPPGLPGVGASGAIFGLMGASVYVVLANTKKLYVRDKRIGIVILVWAIYILITGLLTPYVDNRAHAGGFIGGFLTALFLKPVLFAKNQPFSATAWVFFFIACFLSLLTSIFFIPRLLS